MASQAKDGIKDLVFLIPMLLFVIYGLIYNMYIKYKRKDSEYFVTNKRIGIYTPKGNFRLENIANIEHILISREKDNYGDILFSFQGEHLISKVKNSINFEGVENPRKVVEIIENINEDVLVMDDAIKLMGNRM